MKRLKSITKWGFIISPILGAIIASAFLVKNPLIEYGYSYMTMALLWTLALVLVSLGLSFIFWKLTNISVIK